MRLVCLCLLLSGCSSQGWMALHVADTAQTLQFQHYPCIHETNPVMGRHPSDTTVILSMAAFAVGYVLVSDWIERNAPRYSPYWHGLMIAGKAAVILNNQRLINNGCSP